MAPAERRAVIRILLDSAFYCGTNYGMPLRERLALVKLLEAQIKGHNGQEETAPKLANGLVVQDRPA